jgi:hypothetical protein
VKVQSDRPQAGSVAEGGGNASLGAAERRGAVAVGCRVWLIGGAGQGACREVGSEGFEAKHRAVAENGEPVGPIQVMPSLHYGGEGNTWGAWAQQGVCGRRGGKVLCVTPGGLVRSCSTGWVAGRISREVKSSVMSCEKSEWPAVLMNQGTTETLGLSCLCGGRR